MARQLTGLVLAAFLCASCATSPPGDDPAATKVASAEVVPDTVVVEKVPMVHGTERTKRGHCVRRPPIGSRISKMTCVTAEQRKRNNEEGKRLLEAAD